MARNSIRRTHAIVSVTNVALVKNVYDANKSPRKVTFISGKKIFSVTFICKYKLL